MATELVIKVSGDIKDYESALNDAKSETENLQGGLEDLAAVSGVAFAALSAEILVATKSFGDSQKASDQLALSMQNQGIYSDALLQKYKAQADSLQDLTGIDNDAIVAAQTQLQGMIGQTEISESLTKAILDLSDAKGMDLQSTTRLIGEGILGHTQMLQRLGIEIDSNLDKEGRTAAIIAQVTQRYGGQSEAANTGIGALRGLGAAFDDVQKAIGQDFLPVFQSAIHSLTEFYQSVASNRVLTDFIASALVAGAVVTGLGLTVGVAGTAFLALKAALAAAEIATSATTIAVRGLVGATGLGLVVLVASELYLNWQTIWPRMQQIFESFANNIGGVAGGLSGILRGLVHFDISSVKDGFAQLKSALSQGYTDASKDLKPINIPGTNQDPGKLALAKKINAEEIQAERDKQSQLQAMRALELAKLHDDSAESIQIKQQELDTLKQMADKNNKAIRAALTAHLADLKKAETQADTNSEKQNDDFNKTILADNKEYQQLNADEKALFAAQAQNQLKNSLETEESIRASYAAAQLKADIARRNQFLQDERQFGAAYAAINEAMHSAVYTGTQNATNSLTQLQNSSNAELKAIGKAAAVAQVTIQTAQAAMNIFAGFSAIPFVGPALGVAAAAAAIAYGGERIGQIVAAADGGLITGGMPGIDSVPSLLMPGELVVPKQNFNEVVGAVANQRTGSGGPGGSANIVLTLKDGLMDFIEAKLVERKHLNISIQGA